MTVPYSIRLAGFSVLVVAVFLGLSYTSLLYFRCDSGSANETANHRGNIVSDDFSSCFVTGDLDEFITLHRAYHWGRTTIATYDPGPKSTGAKFAWTDDDHLIVDLGDADLFDSVEQVGSIHIAFKATGHAH